MLPRPYQSIPSAIASYDYLDIAEGTGMRLFYLAQAVTTPVLVQNQTYSSLNRIGGTSATYDWDFDLTAFNSQQYLKGTALISLGIRLMTSTHCSVDNVYIRKWDGTTETTIGTAAGSGFVHGTAPENRQDLIAITLTPTVFKKGEILRVSITFTVSADSGWIGTSPTGDPDATYFTDAGYSISKCYIPFNLDL